jgi:hypothetical protein
MDPTSLLAVILKTRLKEFSSIEGNQGQDEENLVLRVLGFNLHQEVFE